MKGCYWFITFWVALLCGCDHLPSSHGTQAENAVDSFCQAYFRYQYQRAMSFTTDDSRKWLAYAASNVHQEDVEALKAQESGVSIDIDEVVAPEQDTVGYAVVDVENYIGMDSIGQVGHLQAPARYRFDLVKRGGKWKIKLGGMPRGEGI